MAARQTIIRKPGYDDKPHRCSAWHCHETAVIIFDGPINVRHFCLDHVWQKFPNRAVEHFSILH